MAENQYDATVGISSSAYVHPEVVLSDFELKVVQYHLRANTASLVGIGALKPKLALRQKESELASK